VLNWTVKVWGVNFAELEFISLGGKFFGNELYNFGEQILWNWTVYVCGANCVELDYIGFVGRKFCGTGLYKFGWQIISNCTLLFWRV
jgi:hypothetical protein